MSIHYFKPTKQGDLLLINWEAPTKLEKELAGGIGKKWFADIGKETGVRTMPQNAALHVLFTSLAKELNEKGLTVQEVLAKTVELDWNPKRIKEDLWRPIQIALTNKVSTTDLDKTSEIDEIYETLNRFMAQWGIHVPFPSEETKP